jgi:hypothetical protein
VRLGHPFDHQDHQTDRERIVAEHLGADRLGRADHLALDREAALERVVEALEQMDVLGFLAGEVDQGAHAPVVAAQRGPRVIEQERQDELLDHAENAEILVRADLVEDALLERVERVERGGPREALGHEVAREIQLLVGAQDVVELPLRAQRGRQRRLIIEVVVHDRLLSRGLSRGWQTAEAR